MKQISNRKNLKVILENLYTFFVLHLTEGDQKKARDLLKNKDNQIRQQDAVQISFYGGGSLVFMFFSSFFLYIIMKQCQNSNIDSLNIPIKIFRATFIFIYILFAVGFCIQIFQKYKINYLIIFDLDSQYKMTYFQLYTVAFFLLFVQMAFFSLTMMQIEYNEIFQKD